jgi:hypothetical protein
MSIDTRKNDSRKDFAENHLPPARAMTPVSRTSFDLQYT